MSQETVVKVGGSLRLVNSVQISIGRLQRRALEVIDGWDFTQELAMTRKDLLSCGQKPTDNFLARGIWALRKYHAIAVLDPLNGHAVSDVLDPFWHAQILNTEPYTVFCDKILGQYMHHIPLNHEDRQAVRRVRVLYDYTIEVHHAVFGCNDEEFFPSRVSDERLICVHAKDCNNRPQTLETIFPERMELVS